MEEEAPDHLLNLFHLEHMSCGNSYKYFWCTLKSFARSFSCAAEIPERGAQGSKGDLTVASARNIPSGSPLGLLQVDLTPSRSAGERRRKKEDNVSTKHNIKHLLQ